MARLWAGNKPVIMIIDAFSAMISKNVSLSSNDLYSDVFPQV